MNGAAFVANVEGFPVVAFALTVVARDIDVGQEMHLHLDQSVALTGFAAPTPNVERKAPDLIATGARLGCAGEEFPDRGKKTGIGGRVGSGCAPDWALVDVNNFVELVQARDALMRRRLLTSAMKVPRHGGIKRVVDKGRFAGAGNAGHTGQQPHRNGDIKPIQVVAGCPFDHKLSLRIGLGALLRHIDPLGFAKVLAGY